MTENTTQRTTRTFTAPGGKEVEVKTTLNVREHNALKKALYSGVQIEAGETTDAAPTQKISGAILVEVEEKLVELAVVRYGENRTDPANEIMNGETSEDYTAIVKELAGFTEAIFTKAK